MISLLSGALLALSAGAPQAGTAGAPLVRIERAHGGGISAHIEALLEVPLCAVSDVLVDASAYPGWFPTTQSVRVVSTHPDAIEFEVHFKLPWPIRDVHELLTLTRRHWSDGVTVSWMQQRGDLRINQGRWTLVPVAAGRTRVAYDGLLQPRPWVPRWMLRIASRRQAPRMMLALEARSRGRQQAGTRSCEHTMARHPSAPRATRSAR